MIAHLLLVASLGLLGVVDVLGVAAAGAVVHDGAGGQQRVHLVHRQLALPLLRLRAELGEKSVKIHASVCTALIP